MEKTETLQSLVDSLVADAVSRRDAASKTSVAANREFCGLKQIQGILPAAEVLIALQMFADLHAFRLQLKLGEGQFNVTGLHRQHLPADYDFYGTEPAAILKDCIASWQKWLNDRSPLLIAVSALCHLPAIEGSTRIAQMLDHIESGGLLPCRKKDAANKV